MKKLRGATIAMLGALLLSSTALAQQHRSTGTRLVQYHDHAEHVVVEGATYHHAKHGGCCSRGGCYPEDSHCCNPCGPHGLNQLFAKMKQKLCEKKCRCCAKRCDTSCCTEPACGPVDTCCPHPTSYAPELGGCAKSGCRKPLLFGRLFQDKCATGHCGPVYAAPMREGCCAPVIHRGGYPLPPVPTEQYEPAPTPQQHRAPAAPSTERTSGERRFDVHKSTATGRSSRGPI